MGTEGELLPEVVRVPAVRASLLENAIGHMRDYRAGSGRPSKPFSKARLIGPDAGRSSNRT